MDKLKQLTLGEKIVAAAGIVLLIAGFLPWYHAGFGGATIGNVRISGVSVDRNAWQSPGQFWSMLAVLIGLVMAAQVLVSKLGIAQLPDKLGSLGWGLVHLIGGGLALLFVLLKLLNHSGNLSFGFYLGILCVLALAFGGFSIAKERNELPGSLGGGSAGGTGSPGSV